MEKDGGGMKLLALRMSKLWEEMYTQNGKEQHFVFIAPSRQLVLSDGLTIDAIGNGILQRIIWR